MTNKNNKGTSKKEQLKRVEEAKKQKKMMMGVAIIAIVVIGMGMALTLNGSNDSQSPYSNPVSNPPVTTQGEVMIPISDITPTAKYFKETIDGVEVKFFVVEGDDGVVHAAFDACDVCYREKKGYTQDGNVMVCNNCGNQYATNGIGTKNTSGGGCWPGYLETSIEDGNLVISKSVLADGTYYWA